MLAQRTLQQNQQGMTLVEVTVASVIFALIMLAVVTAMRTFGQSYDRLQQVTAQTCLLYTSPSPRDRTRSRMPSSA